MKLEEITTLNDYLFSYGKELTEGILTDAKPLFSPGEKWDEKINTLLRKPFHAQGDVIMAVSKVLNMYDSATLCCEMGTGKTFMSMIVPYIHSKDKNFRCLIICPGHITRKWKREIEFTIPNSKATILRKLKDVILLDTNKKPRCSEFYILSKDKGKLSYSWKPSVIQNKRDSSFLCPDCYKPIFDNDGNPVIFAMLKKKRMSCITCKSPLWSADNNRIRRFALGEYIKKYKQGYFDYLIADEVHQYKGGNTAQGNMFGSLASACKKVISLTGTLAGGYADELFYLIGRMSPNRLIKDGLEVDNIAGFAQRYGVFERVKKIYSDEDNSCSKGKKGKTIIKRKPGISPLVYSKFLMDNTAFLHLEDLAIDLPSYNETVIGVNMGAELKEAYSKLENEIMDAVRKAISTGSTRLLGILVVNLLAYPDRPFKTTLLLLIREKKRILYPSQKTLQRG